MTEFARAELLELYLVVSRQVSIGAGRSLGEVRPIRHRICLCTFRSIQSARGVVHELLVSRNSKRKVCLVKTLSDGASI